MYGKSLATVCDVSYECRNRCTADRKDLDGGSVRWSHEHTQFLMDTFNMKTLWDDHGVVGDILISPFLFYRIILVLIALTAIYGVLSTSGNSKTAIVIPAKFQEVK